MRLRPDETPQKYQKKKYKFAWHQICGKSLDDDDDDVFIELPGLPNRANRGMLCGYKNQSSKAVASPGEVIYLIYNWLCGGVTSGSFAPVCGKSLT